MSLMSVLARMVGVHRVFLGEGEEVEAVRDVSLEMHPGEFLAITGPSGCGKSTLLHLMGGMDRPSRGEIWYRDRPLHLLSETELTLFRRAEVGFVFQFFYLLPTLTVLENVQLPLELAGDFSGRPRALRLLELVGLGDKASRFPRRLSGGEMQRVAVARALVTSPRLLLADEPTGNLDSENGRVVLEKMRELARENGTAVLMATHSREAAGLADRRLAMKDGQVVAEPIQAGIQT